MAQLTVQEETAVSLLVSGGMNRKSAVQRIRRNRKATVITTAAPAFSAPDIQQMEPTPVPGYAPEFTVSAPLAVGDKVELASTDTVETVTEAGPVSLLDILESMPSPIAFDPELAVKMYQAGRKVVDIAVTMGYARGHGQNRVVSALRKAGVYQTKP